MTRELVDFAGLRIALREGWCDITDDLPEGTPPTLAKTDDGIGALQFSTARYRAGDRPTIGQDVLTDLLEEFADSRGLGQPSNLAARVEKPIWVAGDFPSATEFIRVWYLSNGNDVVLITYVTEHPQSPRLAAELSDAHTMVCSIDL